MKEENREKIHIIACAVLFFFANYRYAFLNALGCDIPKVIDLIDLGAIVFSMLATLASINFESIRHAWLRILIFVSLSAVIALFSGEKSILFSALAIICLSGIDLEKIFMMDMICKAAVVLQSIVLCLAGVLDNNACEEYFMGFKYKIFSFGFANANSPAILIMFILIEFVFLYNIRISENDRRIPYSNLRRNLTVVLIGLLTMVVTGNKTLLVIILFSILLSMNKKILKFFGNPFLTIGISTVVVTAAIAYSGYGILTMVDRLISGRIMQSHCYFQLYDIRLFGEPVQMTGLEYYGPITLDCFYPRMLLDFGIIYYLFYLFVSFLLLAKNIRGNDAKSKNAVLVIVMISFTAIIESCYHILWMNPAMLLLPELIFSDFSFKDAWKSTSQWYTDFLNWIKSKVL